VVLAASPNPGEKLVKGAQIQATVSQGPERYPMPQLVGLTQTAAEAALTRGHLQLGRLKSDYSETVASGLVMKASQAVGTPLKKQTVVYLTMSAGPRPIKVDNFENRSARGAVARLKQAGFSVKVSRAHSASVPAGKVISQSPKGGTGHAGDTITLKRSIGPVMVTVPDVKGKGTRVAARILKAAGFQVKVRPVLIGFLGLGSVSYAKPGLGTKVPEGSTITLYTS
jgi:serine/threonine-protein kinase